MRFNQLRSLGFLGINQKNATYSLVVNQRKFYSLVDDKFLGKRPAIQKGIKAPQLYAVIICHRQVPDVLKIAGLKRYFAVKPSLGFVRVKKF